MTLLTDASLRQRFRRRMMNWYRRHARDLPWRRTRDPYAIWVSEIMLQQTQVATVVPYFERFIKRFSTIVALAKADEEDVLRLWEGLGYYRRARQLHRAARIVVAEHDAEFPRDPEVVGNLPGIGRYTAGAILSIAFDAREPVLEANTLRLWSRLLGFRGDPRGGEGQRLLWHAADELMPRNDCGTWNQALMELGAEVCLPRSPRCGVCPVAAMCRARELSLEDQIPASSRRPRVEHVREAAVVMRRNGRVLLIKRTDRQRWAGMWDFPRFELPRSNGKSPEKVLEKRIHDELRTMTGIDVEAITQFTTLRHGVTRFRITLDCYTARCRCAARRRRDQEMRWVKPTELAEFPLSKTGRQLSALVAAGDAVASYA